MSGLLVRQVWPLALMLCADRVPNRLTHFKTGALTQAGSPDPRNDRVCITSLCPCQFPMTLHAADSYAAGNNFGSLNRSPRKAAMQHQAGLLLFQTSSLQIASTAA